MNKVQRRRGVTCWGRSEKKLLSWVLQRNWKKLTVFHFACGVRLLGAPASCDSWRPRPPRPSWAPAARPRPAASAGKMHQSHRSWRHPIKPSLRCRTLLQFSLIFEGTCWNCTRPASPTCKVVRSCWSVTFLMSDGLLRRNKRRTWNHPVCLHSHQWDNMVHMPSSQEQAMRRRDGVKWCHDSE